MSGDMRAFKASDYRLSWTVQPG